MISCMKPGSLDTYHLIGLFVGLNEVFLLVKLQKHKGTQIIKWVVMHGESVSSLIRDLEFEF